MRSIEMRATVTALALGSLLGLAAPAASRATAIDDTEQLIAELSSSRDNADPDLLMQLAGKRSRAACDGLIELYGKMSSIYMKRETVRALATLDGVGDAEQQALEHIMGVATNSSEPELRQAAIEALGQASHLGKTFLEQIVESAADDEVREHAMRLHVERAGSEDHAWYRKLFVIEKGAAKEKKADRKRREKEEQGDLIIHGLASVREMAFEAISSSLKDGEIADALEDPWHGIRRLALEALHARNSRPALAKAVEVFESNDAHPDLRISAARIIAAENGARAADDFIDTADKFITPQRLRYLLADLLAEMGDEKIDKKLARKVGKGKQPFNKLWVLRAVRHNSDPKLSKSIQRCLTDRDESVRVAAARVLAERGDADAVKALQKMIDKTKGADSIAAAVGAMSVLRAEDPEWEAELVAYATHEESSIRNAALKQLGAEGRLQHTDLLAQALGHGDWSTRYAALLGLERLRTPAAIPLLIGRMGEEQGRMLHEFADALFRLTGQPFRTATGNWKAWWEREGAGFELIGTADLAKRSLEEEDRRLKQITNVKFFGIRIVSKRVIFIVDVSGSMNETMRARLAGENANTTRLAVAQRQLATCIDGLDRGALFNIITFSSDVSSWLDTGIGGSTGKTREEAKEWVARLGAMGATNLYDSIRFAFDDPDVDTIFILSDGEPTAGAETDPHMIREHVGEWNENRGIVINTIACGGNLQVLEWLAEDSGGQHVNFR
jgi:HEAT repeat protein